MEDEQNIENEAKLDLRYLIVRTIIFTIVIVAAVVLLGAFFREPVTLFANWLIDELGLFGLLFGIVISDAFTFPVPPDTYLLITVASGGDVQKMLTICCLGSISAGTIAYFFGPHVAKFPYFSKRIEKYRSRGEKLFEMYGVWTVAIAALTPIPFSIVCWFAGIYKMAYPRFFVATLARIPRLVGYYWLFELGLAR